jgi:hypothetical protein
LDFLPRTVNLVTRHGDKWLVAGANDAPVIRVRCVGIPRLPPHQAGYATVGLKAGAASEAGRLKGGTHPSSMMFSIKFGSAAHVSMI